jgi:hypothetical protein
MHCGMNEARRQQNQVVVVAQPQIAGDPAIKK